MWPAIHQRMLQQVKQGTYDCKESFDDCQVRLHLDLGLIDRESNKFFDSLQEQNSQDAYGTLLGRLICFYVRILGLRNVTQQEYGDIEREDIEMDDRMAWYDRNPLKQDQVNNLNQLRNLLDSGADDMALDEVFHEAIKDLFCWSESRKLMQEADCPVQRFLMVACLRNGGNGFIHVRDITPLIAKLLYCIRATVFTELMKREGQELNLKDDLDGLQIYVKDLVQSPFGLLFETMHLAATVAGYSSSLPQVVWLGDEEYKSLTIHGKRVDLDQLQRLCHQLLKDAKRKFRHEIKMGLPGFKDFN